MGFKELLESLSNGLESPQDEDIAILSESEFVRKLIDSVPEALLILNSEREAIFSNMQLLKFIGCESCEETIGKLPGELFKCRHAMEPDGRGCGRTDSCEYCGLFNSVKKSLEQGQFAEEECHILTVDNNAFDLKVWATPLKINNKNYTILALQDNSGEKRREVLEHVFFHDILNSAGGINGLARLLHESFESIDPEEVSGMIFVTSEHLIEEIMSQKQLIRAENGELEVNESEFRAFELMEDVIQIYASHDVARNKQIVISPNAQNLKVKTDQALVRRVIGNMTKNALEASGKGVTITLSCRLNGRYACFSVHNPGVIDDEVQQQLFNRSFSTKGKGRGLGTYSMKLFGEKYLGGKVGFNSSEWAGTEFFLELPVL
jgi:K+-sensing histidine kinase KdpD